MSSKKELRRKRMEEEKAEQKQVNPATLFMIAIAVALLLIAGGALIFHDASEAPFPGAVWSEAHGHWH